jgi:hypothetical protein
LDQQSRQNGVDRRLSNLPMHDGAAVDTNPPEIAKPRPHLDVLDRSPNGRPRLTAFEAIKRSRRAWTFPLRVLVSQECPHGRALEETRSLRVDGGQPLSLPVADGVFVNAKAIRQLASCVAPMNFDQVRVYAPAAHFEVNAKSKSDFR